MNRQLKRLEACHPGMSSRLSRFRALGEHVRVFWPSRLATHTMRLPIYVHANRRRAGLTQSELAYLLGLKSQAAISRLENETRRPTLSALLACVVVFGASPAELFPSVFESVEDAVMRRAYKLHQRLQGNPSKATRAKLDLLEAILKRATDRLEKQKV